MARTGAARLRPYQPGDLCADAGHRRAPRHDGPGAHADDGRPPASRALPALPERQPPGHVRRPADLLRGPHRLSTRHTAARRAGIAVLGGAPTRWSHDDGHGVALDRIEATPNVDVGG